jgi:TetR/AcrR family transcriptional regulator, transcriptional repressor for nem operon
VLEAEFSSLPDSLRVQTEALTKELLAWLGSTLEEGREAGAFLFKGDPADKAALILSSLQGGLQMARALGAEKFNAVVEQHKQDLIV